MRGRGEELRRLDVTFKGMDVPSDLCLSVRTPALKVSTISGNSAPLRDQAFKTWASAEHFIVTPYCRIDI